MWQIAYNILIVSFKVEIISNHPEIVNLLLSDCYHCFDVVKQLFQLPTCNTGWTGEFNFDFYLIICKNLSKRFGRKYFNIPKIRW